MINLAELFPESNIETLDTTFNKETGNSSLVISDGLDGSAYIINREGKIVKEDACGFDSWTIIPSAESYLEIFERYCDSDFQVILFDEEYKKIENNARNNSKV